MTRYLVDLTPELERLAFAGDLPLPDGFRLVEPVMDAMLIEPDCATGGPCRWLAEDDGAPDSLEGLVIEPVFYEGDGQPMRVIERRVTGDAPM